VNACTCLHMVRLKEVGIVIAFPQLDVHIVKRME
jgi:small-conductance mechanosensitive channel